MDHNDSAGSQQALDDANKVDIPNEHLKVVPRLFGGGEYEVRPINGHTIMDIKARRLPICEQRLLIMSKAIGQDISDWLDEDVRLAEVAYMFVCSNGDNSEEAELHVKCEECGVLNSVILKFNDYLYGDILDESFDLSVEDGTIYTFRWPTARAVSQSSMGNLCGISPKPKEEHYSDILTDISTRGQGLESIKTFNCWQCSHDNRYLAKPDDVSITPEIIGALYIEIDIIAFCYKWSRSEILDLTAGERYYWAIKSKEHLEREAQSKGV